MSEMSVLTLLLLTWQYTVRQMPFCHFWKMGNSVRGQKPGMVVFTRNGGTDTELVVTRLFCRDSVRLKSIIFVNLLYFSHFDRNVTETWGLEAIPALRNREI